MALMPMFWGRAAMVDRQLASDGGFWRVGETCGVVGEERLLRLRIWRGKTKVGRLGNVSVCQPSVFTCFCPPPALFHRCFDDFGRQNDPVLIPTCKPVRRDPRPEHRAWLSHNITNYGCLQRGIMHCFDIAVVWRPQTVTTGRRWRQHLPRARSRLWGGLE